MGGELEVKPETELAAARSRGVGAMAAAAGPSFHAMLMGELKVLGGMARADGGRGADGGENHGCGEERDGQCQGGQHHLYYDRTKGWMLRVTVTMGKKVIGKRLKFRLHTRDAGEAGKARDLVLATLKRLGLTVRLRMQGRQRGR